MFSSKHSLPHRSRLDVPGNDRRQDGHRHRSPSPRPRQNPSALNNRNVHNDDDDYHYSARDDNNEFVIEDWDNPSQARLSDRNSSPARPRPSLGGSIFSRSSPAPDRRQQQQRRPQQRQHQSQHHPQQHQHQQQRRDPSNTRNPRGPRNEGGGLSRDAQKMIEKLTREVRKAEQEVEKREMRLHHSLKDEGKRREALIKMRKAEDDLAAAEEKLQAAREYHSG